MGREVGGGWTRGGGRSLGPHREGGLTARAPLTWSVHLLRASPPDVGTTTPAGQTRTLWFSRRKPPCDPKQITAPLWVSVSSSVKWGEGLSLVEPARLWHEASDGGRELTFPLSPFLSTTCLLRQDPLRNTEQRDWKTQKAVLWPGRVQDASEIRSPPMTFGDHQTEPAPSTDGEMRSREGRQTC